MSAGLLVTVLTVAVPPTHPAIKVVYALAVPMTAAGPLAIVLGVLQHRLYDIDVTVRRSVVYAALVAGIAGVYVMLAAAPGLAFGAQIPVEAAVLVTVVAALAFQPLRRRLSGGPTGGCSARGSTATGCSRRSAASWSRPRSSAGCCPGCLHRCAGP